MSSEPFTSQDIREGHIWQVLSHSNYTSVQHLEV